MQQPVVLRDARDVAAVGLDLLQQVGQRVVAVGAAAHQQTRIFATQRQLGDVGLIAARDHGGMPSDAFLRGRRGGEAQVEVAFLGGEFAKRAHGDGVGHASLPCSAQVT
ncbi:hypothetical protein D3C81_2065990 [compost metagenome]